MNIVIEVLKINEERSGGERKKTSEPTSFRFMVLVGLTFF
jgi:hypothetical protein